MLLNESKLPIILIHPDFTIFETIDNIDYLTHQTKLGLQNNALLNCYITDNKKIDYYKIIEIIELENKWPWWRFESFNPLIKIKLIFSKVENRNVLQKLKEKHLNTLQ